MTPNQRKQYRLDLLKKIYDYNFENKFKPYKISIAKEEENSEEHLALMYLMDRGYISNRVPDYNNYTLIITYNGIDFIEGKN